MNINEVFQTALSNPAFLDYEYTRNLQGDAANCFFHLRWSGTVQYVLDGNFQQSNSGERDDTTRYQCRPVIGWFIARPAEQRD
jgi:hypothetical protein